MTEAPTEPTGTAAADRPADPLAALLARCAAGDRAAFRDLYTASAAKLHGIALRMLRNSAEAEDAMQDCYSRIWARAHRFDPARGAAATWLAAVMRNLCIDRLRARPVERAEEGVLERLADGGRGPEAELIARDEARRVLDCLGTLEPDRAQAVRGAYLDGLSYEALSARFDVPLNTMRSWLRRGLMRLRECLEP